MIACLVMTDGRYTCLERTLRSAEEHLNLDSMVRVINDDSGDDAYRELLIERFGPRWTIIHANTRRGFGGAIRYAWGHLRTIPGLTHVFHLEDDFVFDQKVPLYQMADLLDDRPEIVQVALVRQAWNSNEKVAGGLLAHHRANLVEMRTKYDEPYVAQRVFFTTNPSLYRRSLLAEQWPEGEQSEGHFFHQLLKTGTNGVPGDMIQFALWGAIDDKPRCEHIGHERIGRGY